MADATPPGDRRLSRPRRRQRLVIAGVALVGVAIVVAAGLIVSSGPSAPRAPVDGSSFRAYTDGSFFTRPLPPDAPVDPESDRGISFVENEDPSPYPLIRGVDGNEWGMPYVMSDCGDPLWTLSGPVPPTVDFLRTQGFHAPDDFGEMLTETSDSPFVVIDRCGVPAMPRGFTVWGAKASEGYSNSIDIESAGAFQHDSNGLDSRNPRSDSTINSRSRGAIPDAMVIRDDLLRSAMRTDGDLGHVLHVYWLETDSSAGHVHPMIGDESGKRGFGAEGMRLRIKPEVDLNERDCSPAGLVVARTLQRFGGYLGDNGGGATSIKAEQGSEAITEDALSCLTWDDFVFVQRGWDG